MQRAVHPSASSLPFNLSPASVSFSLSLSRARDCSSCRTQVSNFIGHLLSCHEEEDRLLRWLQDLALCYTICQEVVPQGYTAKSQGIVRGSGKHKMGWGGVGA